MFQPCASLCVVVGQLHSDCGFIARELQCALSQLFGCPASSSGLLVALFCSTLCLPFRVASFEEAAFLRACFPTLPCFHCFAAFRQRRFVVRVARRSVWLNPMFSAWVFRLRRSIGLDSVSHFVALAEIDKIHIILQIWKRFLAEILRSEICRMVTIL